MGTSALARPDQGAMQAWQSYTPTLSGQTEAPGIAFSTQVGNFLLVGPMCFFKYKLVTSGTTTKTTTTDLVNVNLPFTSATRTGEVTVFAARVENATAVANALMGEIASNAAIANFRNYVLATASAQMTWATTNPGIGVLSNVITANGSGFYEYAQV